MKTTVVAASGPIGANSAAIPAATPLTNLNKASIGRTAVEDVVFGIVFREFIPVCAKVLRGAVQQRAGLGQQGAPQVSAGRVPGRLGIGGFRSRRAALSGADVEPRLEDGAQVVCGDSMAYLNALREKFDLIFLDPPYADDLLERAVAHIARFDILAPDGIMIAESPAEKELPKLSAPYRVAREYRYGRIKVTLYRRDGEETT